MSRDQIYGPNRILRTFLESLKYNLQCNFFSSFIQMKDNFKQL